MTLDPEESPALPPCHLTRALVYCGRVTARGPRHYSDGTPARTVPGRAVAIRFTCRLIAVRTEDGKFRLKYGHLGESGRVYNLTGPEMLYPPDRDLTAEELDRWEFDVVQHRGYSRACQLPPAEAGGL